MRRLSQKQINKRLEGVTVPVYLIRECDRSTDKKCNNSDSGISRIYYMCPIGWDREQACKANEVHAGHVLNDYTSYQGVESFDPDCFSFLENAEDCGMRIYDFSCLPVWDKLVDFYPGLLDEHWKKAA